ncbi:MAG: hypothetical protein ACK2U2_08815, partial [Anaerolineae bacterium]
LLQNVALDGDNSIHGVPPLPLTWLVAGIIVPENGILGKLTLDRLAFDAERLDGRHKEERRA